MQVYKSVLRNAAKKMIMQFPLPKQSQRFRSLGLLWKAKPCLITKKYYISLCMYADWSISLLVKILTHNYVKHIEHLRTSRLMMYQEKRFGEWQILLFLVRVCNISSSIL